MTTLDLEVSPEQRENSRHILDAIDAGIADCNLIIGYHGTSIESLTYAIQRGCLPGGTRPNTINLGRLYFAPLSKFTSREQSEDPLDAAKIYAELNAQKHGIANLLGLNLLSNEDVNDLYRLRDDGFDPSTYFVEKYFKDHPNPWNEANRLISEALKRRGVVIGLKTETLTDFQVGDGDDEEVADLYLCTPNGLPIKYIHGIQVLGFYEEKYFQELRTTIQALKI